MLGMTLICLQKCIIMNKVHRNQFLCMAGEAEESIKGGVVTVTHLTV